MNFDFKWNNWKMIFKNYEFKVEEQFLLLYKLNNK
jgi:hypothetical protein